MDEISDKGQLFSEEAMENIVGLYDALLRVHCRLMREGWTKVDGKLIPPPGYEPRKK